MPKSVDEILDQVLISEGGYQDDVEDHGNFYKGQNLGTNMGVTPAALAKYRGKDVTREDMLNLTEKEARDLYKKNYVDPIVRNLDPDPAVLPQLVDMNINHGYKNTVVLAQRAAGAKVDGQAGPGTRDSLKKVDPMVLNNTLVDVRKRFYNDIVKSKPDMGKYINGWHHRAEEYRDDGS